MFHSLKSFFSCIIMLLSLHAFAQKKPRINLKDFSEFKFETHIDSVKEKSASADSIVNKTLDIKATHWDNTVYNPYKGIDVKFPLKLQFEDSTYFSPIKREKVITSRYGWRRGRAHKGIDIDLITGDSIFAMFDGIVRMSRYTKGHGRTVVLRHYNGLETVYAHLSRYGVKENDTIKRGQYIGKGGTSGNARGSHLHLVINYKGVSINPEYLFAFNAQNQIRANTLWITRKWTRPIVHNSKRQTKIQLLLTEDDALKSLIKQQSIYVVKPGDTLSRISKRNTVTIASLCKTNAIRRNSIIKVGQKLVIEK